MATEILNVVLNGRKVGNLKKATSGAITFTYDTAWLDDARAIPVSLSLPLRVDSYQGAEVTTVFDNLLPDNTDILQKVAERTGANGTDAFSLLSKIGRDCVGALQFLPKGEAALPPGKPEGIAVSHKIIADRIRNLAVSPLGIGGNGERDFRISIAGAQEKTAFLWNDGWQLPTGSTPTTHIFKPQIGKIANGLDLSQSVENEHFCMTLCRELGLKIAQTEILDFEDVRVLSIERFDRIWTKDGRLLRLPQEDFCQALSIPPTRKYNVEGGPGIVECLHLLSGSDYPTKNRYDFMKAQMLFWIMGATDGHAKNFSLFLNSGGRFQMTPLYDIISTQPNLDRNEMQRREYKLAMAVGKRRNYAIFRVEPRHFEQSAHAAGMAASEVQNIWEELKSGLDTALERTSNTMPGNFPHNISESIGTAMQERLAKIPRRVSST